MGIATAIARAWTDPEYGRRLIADPRAALGEVGVRVGDGIDVTVHEDTDSRRHLVIPPPPANMAAMSTDELEQAAQDLSSTPAGFAQGVAPASLEVLDDVSGGDGPVVNPQITD